MERSPKVRAMVFRRIKGERIGIRLQQIGARQLFDLILNRWRFEFPLAECERLEDGQPWWVISAAQLDELREFCRRNGLNFFEE